MRWYKIIVTNPQNGQIIRPSSLNSLQLPYTWGTTLNGSPTGKSIPGAQNIELDIPVFGYASPVSQGFLRIWGIALAEISYPYLVNCKIDVYAGMGLGLPLANPAQAGLILRGQIYQSLGNWENLDQTLDLYLIPPIIGPSTFGNTEYEPPNLVLVWQAGQPLANALRQCLTTAFPSLSVSIDINSALVQDKPDVHVIPNLTALAEWVRAASLRLLNPTGGSSYLGVSITIKGSTIFIYDNGVSPPGTATIKDVDYKDLIGEPTWIEPLNISFKTVMRADLNVGDYIRLPPGLSAATQGSFMGTPLSGRPLSFQGLYQIQLMRHVGNFRQPDAASWVTIFNAYPVTQTNVTGEAPGP